MKNNKGFSLVELIIVIAIMAILVGVMAPQLIKYIEKSKISSDTQLCDSVRTAITTAMMDPDVVNATNSGVPTGNSTDVDSMFNPSNAFTSAAFDILGTSSPSAQIKSTTAGTGSKIQMNLSNGNQVTVFVLRSGTKTGIGAGPDTAAYK